MRIRLDKIYDSIGSEKELLEILEKEDRIEFEIPFDSINSSNSNIDVMYDYLEVSFIAENLVEHIEIIDYGKVERDKYFLSFILEFKPKNKDEIAKFIYRNAQKYSYKKEPTSDDLIDFNEDLQEYEDKLQETEFVFPDLIDSYYANLVNAGYFQMAADYFDDEEEFLEKEFKKYPERRFSYWKSAASKKLGAEFFVSTEAWIVPTKYSLDKILRFYSGIEQEIKLEVAEKYKYEGNDILINKYSAVRDTISNQLKRARNCAHSALGKFFELEPRHETKFLLSEFGDILVVNDTFFNYVFYLNNAKLNFNELSEIRTKLSPIYENIESIIGLSTSMDLDWSNFDDDKFEVLCYDILYYHPKFDNRTIRKMGKSKSRDGGRDITIRTKEILGRDSELYIFQCKFFKPNSSLTASKIGSASNVIMQFGAKGYGVFTTGVIDATLYDMLDGFARNFGISTRENWSIYEIERYLNMNKSIRQKYF